LNAAAPGAPSRTARFLGVALLASIGVWPLLPVLSSTWPALAPLERLLQPWFALQCERDPARTLWLGKTALAVCARCSGIYFGLGLGALVRRPALAARGLALWALGAAALMLIDVALERGGAHGAWATLRLATGALLGYPVGAGLAALLARPTRSAPVASQSP
jgi:uncharacterized membrane protein